MAISYVGGQVAGRAGNVSTATVTFALTGGTNTTPQPRDLVVITPIVASQGRTPAQAVSGYTALGQLNANGTTYDTSLDVSWKEMGNTPDVSFTLPATGDIADAQRYTIQVFRGVDTSGIASVTASGTGTGRPNPGGITPTIAGSWVVICGGGAAATGASYTAPADFTTNFLTGTTSDTNDAMVGSGYWDGWTSGAVDPAAYTGGTTNAADSWAAYTIVLPPLALVTRTDPVYVDSTIDGDNTLTVPSISSTAPSMSSGDLDFIVASAGILAGSGAAPGIQTPSGFTPGPSGVSTGIVGGVVNTRVQTFWRIASGAGSAATIETVGSVNAAIIAVRTSYSDPDPTTPIRQGLFGAGASSTTHVLSSMVGQDKSVITTFLSLGAAETATPPGSMTEREDNGTFGVSSADETLTADGATGTRTFTVSAATDSVWGFIEIQGAEASASHDTTGALVGPGSIIAGSAAHIAVHGTSGDLTGPGSSIAGSAGRTRAHSTSGDLTGPGSSIVGSARHNEPHPSSGDLVGPGSVISGSAARTHVHPSSGDLVGPGSTVAGSAARTRVHPSSGALSGPGSEISGSAARTRVHPSSGDLVGPGAEIVGDADHQGAAGTHDTTGALVGQGSTVAGTAARFRAFSTSGALTGQGSVIEGSAARIGAAVTHDSSGALVGPGAIVDGQARNGAEDPQVGIFWPPFWWYRNKELEEELEKLSPEVKEVIIEAAEKAVNDEPVEIRAELKREKIRYRNQYKEIYLQIVEEMRQSEEDEEIAAIIAFL